MLASAFARNVSRNGCCALAATVTIRTAAEKIRIRRITRCFLLALIKVQYRSCLRSQTHSSFQLLELLTHYFRRQWEIASVLDYFLLSFATQDVGQKLFQFWLNRTIGHPIEINEDAARERIAQVLITFF